MMRCNLFTLRDDNINTPFVRSPDSISSGAYDHEGGRLVTPLRIECLYLGNVFAKVYTKCEPDGGGHLLKDRLETGVIGRLSHIENPSNETDTHRDGDTLRKPETGANSLDSLLQLNSSIEAYTRDFRNRIKYSQTWSYQPQKVQNPQKQILRP